MRRPLIRLACARHLLPAMRGEGRRAAPHLLCMAAAIVLTPAKHGQKLATRSVAGTVVGEGRHAGRPRGLLFRRVGSKDRGRDPARGAPADRPDHPGRPAARRCDVRRDGAGAAADGLRSERRDLLLRDSHADLLRCHRRARAELSRLEFRLHRSGAGGNRRGCGRWAEPANRSCARRHYRGRRRLCGDRPDRDHGRAWLGGKADAAGGHGRHRGGDRPRACADRDPERIGHRARQPRRHGLRALDRADHRGGGWPLRRLCPWASRGASRS
jgi:hypothetical protein